MFSYATKSDGVQPSASNNDPNFNQVSVLLHCDGTNGSQNNTFLDSSTNNFTITRNGTATQGTYTPFSQAAGYWSNYNPNNSYLTVATNSAFTYGTNSFTIECWVYLTTTGSIQYIIDQRNIVTSNAVIPTIYVSASNVLTYFVSNSAQITGTTALTTGTWYHVAVSRSATSTKMFLNGVQEGSTYTDSNNYVASRVVIGSNASFAGNYLVGYVSNVRLVNGTAVYTTAFTPSTTPLTAVTNTSLLTCQSNYFKDNSSNNFTITTTGTPSAQPWSCFVPTSAYSTSVNGGSGFFNGTTDYLTAPTGSAFAFGTESFTLETFIYIAVNPSGAFPNSFYILFDGGTGLRNNAFIWLIQSNGTMNIFSTSTFRTASTSSVPLNQWVHLAIVRNGNTTLTYYINGIAAGTATLVTNLTTGGCVIGRISDENDGYIRGYLSSTRILKGTALYTANFTPPTAPLTAITNTSLLLNGTNAGIVDNAIKSDSITVGATQVNTSVVKYGTGSISFNGTTSVLNFPNNPYYALGTANFTIEAWVYPNSVTALQSLIDTRSTATATTGILISITAAGFISITVNNAILFTSSTGITISAWTHVAVVKSGTTITLYLNGTKPLTGSGTSSTSLTDQFLRLGASAGTAANFYNGYLDEVRITNGIARYTADFTAPTAPFPNQ
jgi:hypothetical protein